MCMKEAPMKNRELKPGYNLQIATNQQFVIDYQLFPNPTDTRTLRPFLDSISTLDLFSTIAADAGYGSEENYQYVIDTLEKTALISYNLYRKEQIKRYQQDMTRRENWHYDETLDLYVDHHGVQFSFSHYSQKKDKYGFERAFKVYQADKVQATEALDELARTKSGYQRKISINQLWESYKQQVNEALESESGKRLYG